jgi:hypothetical protein
MTGERIFWPVTVFLLAAMLAAQASSMLRESQIYDEAVHLAAGYSYLTTGDYRLNPEHPPLSKLLAAAPLLLLKPHLPVEDPSWSNGDTVYFGAIFLYFNRVPAETMLHAARCVILFCALSFGLFLALWTRRRFGPGPAMLALFLYTFDPNMIAHGHYVTSDLLVACLMFVAVALWVEFLSSGRNLHLAGAGVALGLAAATKFSGLILIPIFLILYVLRWKRERDARFSWRRLAISTSAVLGLGLAAIAVCYGPETMKIAHGGRSSYLLGLETVIRHDRDGHPSYLLGQIRKEGWWYYFPVAFAVKTPTAVLLLLLLSVVICVGQSWPRLPFIRPDPRAGGSGGKTAYPTGWYVLTVPIAAYFLLSMRGHINIGLRHILPVYPFLFVFVAAALFNAPWPKFRQALPVLLAAAVLIEVAESAAIYPHYLAFFNFPSGGPSHGARYLLDSNIDWGQDLKNLRRWLDEHGSPPVCVQYFGMGYPKLYGLPQNSLPATWEAEKRARLDCIGAISVTLLHDVYLRPGEYAWLREMRPIGNVGYSIALFDLRKPGLP